MTSYHTAYLINEIQMTSYHHSDYSMNQVMHVPKVFCFFLAFHARPQICISEVQIIGSMYYNTSPANIISLTEEYEIDVFLTSSSGSAYSLKKIHFPALLIMHNYITVCCLVYFLVSKPFLRS